MPPALAATVIYVLTADDAKVINQRRDDHFSYLAKHAKPVRIPGEPGATGHIGHAGRQVTEGGQFPGIVVGLWPDGQVNLQVLLDGNDTFWAQAIRQGDGPGEWQWPAAPKPEPRPRRRPLPSRQDAGTRF